MTAGHPGETPHDPIEGPILGLAREIHGSLVNDLEQQGALPMHAEQTAAGYPAQLFGALSLHIANVNLSPNATPEERAQVIFTAMQRITTTPELLDRVTGVPGLGLYGVIQAERPTGITALEAEKAAELRLKIAQSGCLARRMLDNNDPVIQLNYTTTKPIRHGFRRKQNEIPKGSNLILQLAPTELEAAYTEEYKTKSWQSGDGWNYHYPLGPKRLEPKGAFRLISVESETGIPPRLEKLQGEFVDIGEIGLKSSLILEHNFYVEKKVTRTETARASCGEFSLPAALQQAYLGNTRQPLFVA